MKLVDGGVVNIHRVGVRVAAVAGAYQGRRISMRRFRVSFFVRGSFRITLAVGSIISVHIGFGTPIYCPAYYRKRKSGLRGGEDAKKGNK